MAAWFARCSRSGKTLLGPCKDRFLQKFPPEGPSHSSWARAASGNLDQDKAQLFAEAQQRDSDTEPVTSSGAWLPPHLIRKVLDLANGMGRCCSQAIGVNELNSCIASRGFSTAVEALQKTVKESPVPWWVNRLKSNGVELVGQLALESKRVRIKQKQVFAVVQVGPHQFKVTPDDVVYVEKLNGADVRSKILLKKVLLLGSRSKTIIGRPFIETASVSAMVEAQAKDAKVLILKKRRRKNSRRLKGHRQELTRLRILDIAGIDEDRECGKPGDSDARSDVVARFKTPESGKISAYAFQPKPLPQSRDLKKQRRSPAVPGYGRRLKRRLTFAAERRQRKPSAQ